ncbi:glycerophosphodiester phosphodiesterase family protein [Blastococcus sp. BMG 814]|uniref:glycerophosphodiester phosphodiesterase n=1 Tax=Blastococcus carthaginiensis TaxID=3050034 RepID=A0ABT9I6T5_9ACTN|nr:glycerophosphodiester phosphodiesterase family protein [Blastococcus carthaginiensis]MDP5181258.1 glycerophosphodiester phosphodiesterase family protein [Blastococcus carthaginiensis]
MRATESLTDRPVTRLPRPVVIGHRGAPAYRPEHTRASFELAVDLGADLIEPDVVLSRDGVLVVRHETELSLSTDVADHPEFADRRTTKVVDGELCTGWFTEDFAYAELRTLRAVERMPALRPLNTAYDGRFGILTLGEVVELARCRSTADRRVRVLAELKHAECTEAGRSMAGLVAEELRRLGADRADGDVVLQSFDPAVLRRLRALLGEDGPQLGQLVADLPAGDAMVTPAGLREVSTYAQVIGPSRERVLASAAAQALTGTPHLVEQAHAAELAVFCWTLRAENAFLPEHLRRGTAPDGLGDAVGDAMALLALGVDGLISDSPDHAVRARTAVTAQLV